jgi:parvulin-like peptidyl-prolyl isomerase
MKRESVKKTLSLYSDEALRSILKKEKITISEWRDEIAYNLLIKKVSSHILDKNIEVSDKEVRKYYLKNLKEFEKPLRLRARQILVNSLEEAKEIRKSLISGGNFQKIAKEKSIGPEAISGGDLGYLSKGEMPESFDEVLFDMEVGEVSRIVKTDYGFHIFQLVSKQNPEKTNPKEAFKIIRKRLIDEKSNNAFKKWKDQLTKQSVVKYY